MGSNMIPDKRLQRRGGSRLDEVGLQEKLDALPDSADQIYQPTEEEVEAFRSSLETEEQIRKVRIERALTRAAQRIPAPHEIGAEADSEPETDSLDGGLGDKTP